MWVGWCWGPLLGGSCGGSMDKGVEGLGASSHSSAMPPTRKVVSSVGRVGSLHKSSPTLNLTYFFLWSLGVHFYMGSCRGGHFLVCDGASPLYTLLWDYHGLGWQWRSPREQLSYSSVVHDCGELGEGDWHLLGG